MFKNKKILAILGITHSFVLILGFGLGVYFLPILTAPDSVDVIEINKVEEKALYESEFVRELNGSDLFHWGDAKVTISDSSITVNGKISPGPDYKLYLTKKFVEDEISFLSIKDNAQYISEVKTFENFIIDIPNDIRVKDYNTIVIWCESFNEFITAAKYQT